MFMACITVCFQSFKPKSGVFCFLIHEARETTALEMPDHENTFVLKVYSMTYHIYKKNMLIWVILIKYA